MSHTFLSLDMSLIPEATRDNVPTFWKGLFSNDGKRMMIDGRDKKGDLVHPDNTLLKWLQWEADPIKTKNMIIDSSIEYTAKEYESLRNDINSIWYVKEVLI